MASSFRVLNSSIGISLHLLVLLITVRPKALLTSYFCIHKKVLNEPGYYNGVVSHPEPDILESKVKWALGSTAVNKASGCNGIPVELFKTLKDDAIKMLHSICQQIWKTQQWPQDWKRSILIPIPKECANHQTIALISHDSKDMLTILHARLQHYANQACPDVQDGFRKGRGTRDQIANICWILEKAREFQKNILFHQPC